ncbi:MAG: hypothetical protein COA79_03445 [Planctomycetota bacterium]|nr:MAG: hypothetical protein COA79_03445 [Planctomycetota bacterium]
MNIEFLGKLHPFMVHFPIGIIPIIVFFHLITYYKKDLIKPEGYFYLWCLASISALLTIGFGWINLNYAGAPISPKEDLHESLGYFVAFLCVVNLVLWKLILQEKKLKNAYYISVATLVISLSYGGHLGAELTHGSLNPFDFFSTPNHKTHSTTPPTITQPSKITKPTVSFKENIEPILQEYCYDCHSDKKQKGRLRLDTYEFILAGGKNGKVVISKNAQKSELFGRIILPEDDEDVMPSKGDLLNNSQIELIKNWINQGAKNN